MKNWKTTIFGIISAAAAGVATQVPEAAQIAGAIAAVATALMGIFAQDHDGGD